MGQDITERRPRDSAGDEPFGLERKLSRRTLIKGAGAGGALLVLPNVLAACDTDDEGGSDKSRGGTLTIAREQEPLSFDPVAVTDNGSIFVILTIFDQLVRINAESDKVEPALAESWDVSSDQLTYRFQLRDAQFSDGSDVTAEDVVFSLNRAFSPKTSSYSFLFPTVDEVRARGKSTVEIRVSKPTVPLIDSLALFTASITPKRLVERDEEAFGRNPVGSGPFTLATFEKGRQTLLARNENYWQEGKPFLDEV